MLPATVKEMAAGHRVSVATLFEFEFASSTQRFWDGLGKLNAGGHEWLGFGQMGGVTGLEQSRGMSAPQATFTLSGVDDNLIGIAVSSTSEVTGRPCAVYMQFLSGPYQTLDDPIALWAGTMDALSYKSGTQNQQISLTAETLFVNRNRAPRSYLTDTDQRARYFDDVGFEFTALLKFKTVNWLRG